MSKSSRKTALITGGAGFVGSHLVDRVLAEGYHVIILDNFFTGCMRNLKHLQNDARVRVVRHDVQHPFPTDLLLGGEKLSLIFHLACAASPVFYQSDPIGTLLTSVNGMYHALHLATAHGCRILFASTSEVYGDAEKHPQREDYQGNVNCPGIRSCYDEGKRAAESLCFDFHRRYGTQIRVVRIFNTYGPRMRFNDGRIISNFLIQALQGKNITVYGTGESTRSFQFVDDLVEGLWRMVNHPTEIGPVNIGTQDEWRVVDMARKITAMVPNTSSQVVFLPPLPDDPRMRRADSTKAKNVLGWEPKTSLEEGLRRTLEDFKQRMESGESEDEMPSGLQGPAH